MGKLYKIAVEKSNWPGVQFFFFVCEMVPSIKLSSDTGKGLQSQLAGRSSELKLEGDWQAVGELGSPLSYRDLRDV